MLNHRQSVVRALLGLLLATSVAPTEAAAQGPVYRERWGYLHLENRRAKLWTELLGRGAEDVQKVGDLLSAPDGGVPFAPVANAIAHLRGAKADAAFLMRSALSIYVLPEVVDPESTVSTCQSANFSVCLPFTLPAPGEMTFLLTVTNEAGKEVWSQLVDRNCSMKDVRLGQATASAPGKDLPDGTYHVSMVALFDGKGPREHDPQLRWPFYVSRGYQKRAELAMTNAIIARGKLVDQPRALLDGLAAQVSRAFSGEAFAVESTALRDLELLEKGLANVADEKPVLSGMSGNVATALPAGKIVQPCVLRLPKDADPHPMVVFVTGSPSYDIGSRRPTAPAMRESQWLMQELQGFGVTEGWHVAAIDSPGGGRPFGKALLASLQALPKILPTGGQKPLLVCDREAAAIVGMQIGTFQPHLSGIVMVGSGAMPVPAIKKLGRFPVRYVSLRGYPGSKSIERTIQYLEASGQDAYDVAMLHERQEPWLYGVARSRKELRTFAVQVFGER